jgi:hydroxymethylpyrimidine pyrophosphatase-like HAD family hydrolase
MIRLIAIDLDGTLLDSQGHLPEANRAAIGQALAAGIEIVIATGRRFDFARLVFEQLPAPLTLILSNGAIVKSHDGETRMRRLLPRAIARDVLARTPEHRGSAAVIFDRPREGQVVFESIDWEHPHHRRFFDSNRPFLSEVRPLEDALTEDPLQVMFTGGCAAMRGLFEDLRQRGADGNHADCSGYSVALTEHRHRDFSFVDVSRKGCSKGSALREWTERQGVTPAEVMAVGDNVNDLEMLQFAGLPVVMGNATDDLKGRGWTTTATNDLAGVARAIETLGFGKAS